MPYNIQKVYSDITKRTVAIIESEQDIVIAGNSIDELVEYYFLLEHFVPIELDIVNKVSGVVDTGFAIPASISKEELFSNVKKDFDTESVVINIPLKPNHSINRIK